MPEEYKSFPEMSIGKSDPMALLCIFCYF